MIKTFKTIQHLRLQVRVACLVMLALRFSIAYAQSPVVYAVLFYSPGCGHCQKVIQDDLPPMIDKFGANLQILGINVSTTEGQELYRAAVEQYKIPEDRLGVPCLIIGDTVLVGSIEIPEMLPGLIEKGISSGGISIPEIPGLQDTWAAAQQNPAGENTSDGDPSQNRPPQENSGLSNSPGLNEQNGNSLAHEQINAQTSTNFDRYKHNFFQDPRGNSISVILLIAMVGSLIAVGYRVLHSSGSDSTHPAQWIVPVLALIGVFVAGYLSYVEISQTHAVCGPIGECNLVQQSPYARLFGILPVGILGLLGYLTILGLWVVQQFGRTDWQRIASLGLGLLSLLGVIFSIYLTFLEPFVIGATCLWCITSALLMTLILWFTFPQANISWIEIRKELPPE